MQTATQPAQSDAVAHRRPNINQHHNLQRIALKIADMSIRLTAGTKPVQSLQFYSASRPRHGRNPALSKPDAAPYIPVAEPFMLITRAVA
jgi:hypothetical protein